MSPGSRLTFKGSISLNRKAYRFTDEGVLVIRLVPVWLVYLVTMTAAFYLITASVLGIMFGATLTKVAYGVFISISLLFYVILIRNTRKILSLSEERLAVLAVRIILWGSITRVMLRGTRIRIDAHRTTISARLRGDQMDEVVTFLRLKIGDKLSLEG